MFKEEKMRLKRFLINLKFAGQVLKTRHQFFSNDT